jgi:hypothetical protein
MSYIYQPLLQHLARSASPELSMSYAEIEAVLGRRLPPSARNEAVKRQWWANTETHSQAKAWLANGRKAKLDVRNDVVTFYRNGEASATLRSGPLSDEADVHVPRASLQPAAIRLVEDYMEEHEVEFAQAMADLLNQAARRHRREALDWFAGHTTPSSTPSSELIRMDRDGR